MRQQQFLLMGVALSLGIGACGSDDPGMGMGPNGGSATGDYFPFALGNTWEYDVNEIGQASVRKLHTIVRMEPVGAGPDKDKVVFRVETRKKDAIGVGDATISWQAREGNKVVRYREQSCRVGSVTFAADGSVDKCTVNEDAFWSPPRVRLDEKPEDKAYSKDLSWMDSFMETKTTYSNQTSPPTPTTTMTAHKSTWKVVELDVTVTTSAGTFPSCVKLQKTSQTDVAKSYTFCRGVGKVREEGAGQTEVLATRALK